MQIYYQTPINVWVLAPVVIVLSILQISCGISEEQRHAYRNASTIKPIEMPPGLEMARGKDSLAIPAQTEEKLASIDELEKPPRIVENVNLNELDEDEAAKTDSEKKAKESAELKSKAVSVTATRNTNGDSILLVDEVFDKVWPLVKPALIELGFSIDDSSRGTEMYVISKELPDLDLSNKPIHPADEEKEKVKEEYQIHVKPSGEQTQITVHNKLGQLEGSGLADHLLLQIKEIMENPKDS